MKATEVKRLKELVQENACLKRLLADAELKKAMIKELAVGKIFFARRNAAGPCVFCRITSGCPSAGPVGWPARTARHSAGRYR